MPDLFMLNLENGKTIRCTDIGDARAKAISIKEGKIILEIIPEGQGGPITTLEFDRNEQDWIPV